MTSKFVEYTPEQEANVMTVYQALMNTEQGSLFCELGAEFGVAPQDVRSDYALAYMLEAAIWIGKVRMREPDIEETIETANVFIQDVADGVFVVQDKHRFFTSASLSKYAGGMRMADVFLHAMLAVVHQTLVINNEAHAKLN